MACDATARLYDVDEDSVEFEKLQQTEKYDQGRITFRAREDRLIDLDKLHESIWATRLSGGTRSGLLSLQVTAEGRVVTSGGTTKLQVSGADAEFLLSPSPQTEAANQWLAEAEGKLVRVTGVIDNYRGRWPDVLAKPPAKPRRILVTEVDLESTSP